MAPKPKPKKKTKEELEEERRKAEEEARLAEEARIRELEVQRQRQEAEEAARRAREEDQLAIERARLEAQREDIAGLLQTVAISRQKWHNELAVKLEWVETLACSPLPSPKSLSQLNDHLSQLEGISTDHTAPSASLLSLANDSEIILEAVEEEMFRQLQFRHYEKAAILLQYRESFAERVQALVDQTAAYIMFRSEEFSDGEHHVQMALPQPHVRFGLWMNTAKNPRLRSLPFPEIQASLEIPKQIALASVALRLHQSPCDRFFFRCANEWRALGGIFTAELAAMPPQAKKIKNWTLRAITPLSTSLQRVPYPIPPAGADAATIATLEAAPLSVSYHIQRPVHLTAPPQVGWWDDTQRTWRSDGITDVTYDPSNGRVSFTTTRLAPLALLGSRTALFPYQSWFTRPTRGRGGDAVSVHVKTAVEGLSFEFECSSDGCRLLAPNLPITASLIGAAHEPRLLLRELSQRGFHLLPEDRDAPFCGCAPKSQAAEETLCEDLAMVAGAFLTASSKWNQAAAAEDCYVRLSEVVDWEGGGRTEAAQVERIFAKERQDRANRVLCAVQRGARGVCFVDALDTVDDARALPDYGSEERYGSVYGEVHASLLYLLQGVSAEGVKDAELAKVLRATPEALSLARDASPRMTEVISQLLTALRVFSFGVLEAPPVAPPAPLAAELATAQPPAPEAAAPADVAAEGDAMAVDAPAAAAEGAEAPPAAEGAEGGAEAAEAPTGSGGDAGEPQAEAD